MILLFKRYGILLGLILSAFVFNGCDSGPDPLFTFPMEVNFTIPPGLNSFDTHYFVYERIPTFYRNYVDASSESSVDHINAGRGEIRARLDNIDWSIVREVAIHIVDPNDNNINKEAFYQDVVQFSGVEELRLFSSLPELKDILFNDFITVEIRFNFRRVPFREMDARLTMNFVAYGPE
ncbi:MAG: hypothetical protein ACJA01_001202 [Saprospiraceae bacterium]|jgi:hypothetical protein